MKKWLFVFILMVALQTSHAQQKSEYCILRIINTLKTTGVESKLSIDIGTSKDHSLYNVFENNKNGYVVFKNSDGSTLVIKDEVDFLPIMERFGFKLIQVYTNSILDKSFVNYLFEKKL